MGTEAPVWLGILVLLAGRVALSLHDIRLPGLQQDETLFVNAATLRLPGIGIVHQIGGIPMMIFHYTGALKSWIYDPIFAVAGTSPTAIRLPAVIIVCVGLALVYPAVRTLVNRPVAILSFAVLCFDNSVFWLTRDDVGPSTLEFFLKCGALFCVARFATNRRLRWVVLLLVVLALGVFNKLNFIWVVNASLAVSIVLAFKERRSLRVHRRLMTVWGAGLALIYIGWAWYSIANHIRSGLLQPWHTFATGMRGTLAGTWFYNYALAPWKAPGAAVALILVLFLAGVIASVARRTRSLAVAMMALTTLILALEILATKAAMAGWHYVSIYPFVSVVAAYGVYGLAVTLVHGRRTLAIVLASAGVLVVTYDGVVLAKYFRVLHKEPTFVIWTPSIYALSQDLQHSHARVFTADWGIFEPLYALHPGRRLTQLEYKLEQPTAAQLAVVRRRVSSTSGPKLIITHPADDLVFKTANRNLFRALGPRLHLVRTIPGADRAPVYDLYAYR